MTDHPTEPHPIVAVLSRDLFFGMRIRNALRQMGYTTDLRKREPDLAASLDAGGCVLAFVDFNDEVDWDAIAKIIVGHPDIPVIAFGPHTDVDGFKAARAAGATRVISNGAFSQQLPDLVERYAHS